MSPLGLTPRAALASGRLWASASYVAGADPMAVARKRLSRMFWRMQPRATRRLFLRGFTWQWRLIEAALTARPK